jgi:hypothetical protein
VAREGIPQLQDVTTCSGRVFNSYETIQYIVVPFYEIVEMLKETIDNIKDTSFITDEQAKFYKDKVISYEDLRAISYK